MRASKTFFASLLLLLGACSQNAPTVEDKSIEPTGEARAPSAFATAAIGCLEDNLYSKETRTSDDWLEAASCLSQVNVSEAALADLEKGLTELDGLRRLAEAEGYGYLGPDIEPGSARDIVFSAMGAGNSACVSLMPEEETGHTEKLLRCQTVVQAAIAYQIATSVYDDAGAVEGLLPSSPRASVQGCNVAYDQALENAYSSADMLQAHFDRSDCVREANEDTIYEDHVGDAGADDPRGAQNMWQYIQRAMGGIQPSAGKLCELMVSVSDSPEGSISRLYQASCLSDVETFFAIAVDTVRAADAPQGAAEAAAAE